MALFFADLVREQSWATGSGPLALGGPLPGHRSFVQAVPAGARFHYCIAGVTNPGEWETGEGEIDSGGLLERAPLTSSAGTNGSGQAAPVDFAAGLKTVALTVAANWFEGQEAPPAIGDVSGLEAALDAKAELSGAAFTGPVAAPSLSLGSDLAVADGGTGGSTAPEARANLGLVIGEDVQAHDTALSALAELDASSGLIEQTGPDSFAKRSVGMASGSSLPTRDDADGRYQPLDAELSAIAGLASAADRMPYFTSPGTAALAAFTAAGRALVDDSDAAAQRMTLGLGTAAIRNTGTSGEAVPVLNGGTTSWAAGSVWGGTLRVSLGGGYFRGSGATATSYANGAVGIEHDGTAASITAYNATTAAFSPVQYFGASHSFYNGGTQIAQFSAGALSLGGSQVLTTRRSGWQAPTGTATRLSFASETVTTAQLAERVKALIDDLMAHGLIGS